MSKSQIEIWDSAGLGIIVEFPTGILTPNQTGSTACLQSKFEGVYLPLFNNYTRQALTFMSSKYKGILNTM